MRDILKRLWKDERGFVVSAEMVLIVTIGVLGMIVGISSIASSINNEMNDISNAFGALDQSYWYSGLTKVGHSGVAGSGFADSQDFCDCSTIVRTVPRVKFPGPVPPRVGPPPVFPPRVVPPGPWGYRFGNRGWWSEAGVWQTNAWGGFGFGFGAGGFGGSALFIVRHADGTSIPLGGGATAILVDGSVVSVGSLSAIRLGGGGFLPLAAGCAIQLADGSLVALPGVSAFRLPNGTLIRLAFGSVIQLPNGTIIPLAFVGDNRFAPGQAVALSGAFAVRFADGFAIAFPDRTVTQIVRVGVALPLTPAAVWIGTDGLVWIAAAPAAGGANAAFAAGPNPWLGGSAISLATATVVRVPGQPDVAVGPGSAFRLLNGSLIPLSQSHFVRLANGADVPLNIAVAVRLYDGSYVALANSLGIQLDGGRLIPLSANGELRLTSGTVVSLYGAAVPAIGAMPGAFAPQVDAAVITLRNADGNTIPLGSAAMAVLADGSVVPVGGLSAIRLPGGGYVPLNAASALHRADGRLVATAGIAAFRQDSGLLLRPAAGASVRLTNGAIIPLFSAEARFAAGKTIALTGASAVRFRDSVAVAFAERSIVRVLKLAVAVDRVPVGISLGANGVVWMAGSRSATDAGASAALLNGTLVSLSSATSIHGRDKKRIALGNAAMIRLANGSLVPVSQAYAIRLNSGAMIPLNLAMVVRLYDRSYVALSQAVAIQLTNGKLISLANAGELRLKSGMAIPCFGCIGPKAGCLQLQPAGPAPKHHIHPPHGKVKKFGKKFHPGKKGPEFKGKSKYRKPFPSKKADE